MSSVDLGGGGKSHKKGKGVKKPKRIGFRLDMTPLVDVAFLLLTFFMFATTMSQPQIMEVQTPPDVKTEIEVKASELVTIYLRDDGKLFYATGLEPENYLPLDAKKITEFSVKRNKDFLLNQPPEKANNLIMILKVSPNAQYAKVVEVLDKLNLAEGELTDIYAKSMKRLPDGKNLERQRRFSILPIEPEVKDKIDTITT